MMITDAAATESSQRLLQPAPLRGRGLGPVGRRGPRRGPRRAAAALAALPQPGPRAPRGPRARQRAAALATLTPTASSTRRPIG